MSMPEFVIMHGVEMAWKFLRENLDYSLGYLARELPIEQQEEYRKLIREDDVSVIFGYPTQQTRLPSFSILLQSENEDPEGQFVGDAGPDNRALPFPAVNNDTEPEEDFYGTVYATGDNQAPETLGLSGLSGKQEVRNFPPREIYPDTGGDDANATGQPEGTVFPVHKGQWQQRESGTTGDEQYEIMGNVQKLWARDGQRLFSTVVGDRISIGILITTNNAVKTLVYYRLLRWVMRRFTTWFIRNGVLNPTYSGGDLSPNEGIMPTVSTLGFQRTLSMSFLHHDISIEVEPVLAKFMFEMEMVIRKQDGSLETTELKFGDS